MPTILCRAAADHTPSQQRFTRARRAALAAIWVALATLLWAAAPALAAEREVDRPAYLVLVREVAAAARQGDRLAVDEAAERLLAVTSVRLDATQRVAVDNAWLRAALARPDADLATIAAQLGAITDALSLPVGAAPQDYRARLDAIIGRPPYAQEPQGTSWWESFWRWVNRMLTPSLSSGSGTAASGSLIDTILIGVAVAAVVGLAIYLGRGLLANTARSAKTRETDLGLLSAQDAIAQADSLNQIGDRRLAVRYLYLAALLRLDERGALRYDKALTNREYLWQLGGNLALRGRLEPIIETFDRVWYGQELIDELAYRAYAADVEQLGRA